MHYRAVRASAHLQDFIDIQMVADHYLHDCMTMRREYIPGLVGSLVELMTPEEKEHLREAVQSL